MRLYELVVVLKSSLSETERKKLIDLIKSWFGDLKFAKEEDWGQKVLAYPIKRELSGSYLYFQLEGESVSSDFEKRLLSNEQVLRHLLIRKK